MSTATASLLGMRLHLALYGMQDIADQAEGDNVLVVTHGDAVNSSVSRLMPWSIVYPVLHTGFTVAYRDQHEGMSPLPTQQSYPNTTIFNTPTLNILPQYCHCNAIP